ncbi:response regulator [Dongia rigui]|uniref:Response regulator n=1 Tax=Dongia rigui TaxID=940149 RepID=A0ABU5DVR4_9PROT|nr:response regulator [Dongia rigui]MDY0871303.1 response regulator [Dongia rigui]
MKTDPKRILIIDDDQGFRDFARDAAATQGWVVETAANGREGCLAFANFNPDVVILDIVMPKMDGFEVLDWLSEARAQCRIILLTGYNPSYATMAEQLGEAKGLPAVTMLTKPVRLTALVAAIAT